MKTRQFVVILGLLASLGVSLPAQTPEVTVTVEEVSDPVVITVAGREFTKSDVERLRRHVPAQFRQGIQNMTNREFVESFGYLQALAARARQEGLASREPYRTQLVFNEINFLANSYLQMTSASMRVTDAEKQAYYDENPDQFQEVKVSAIYINYTAVPELAERQGRTVVTEDAAREKAQGLHAQLVAGADFAALASENSDDENSAAKGGDLGYFKPGDPLSDAIKGAVFTLDVGEFSEPVKDAGRFYLFVVTDKRVRPLADVDTEVERAVSGKRLKDQLEAIRSDVKVSATDQEWLDTQPNAR